MSQSLEDLGATVAAHGAKHEEHFRTSSAIWGAVHQIQTDNKALINKVGLLTGTGIVVNAIMIYLVTRR